MSLVKQAGEAGEQGRKKELGRALRTTAKAGAVGAIFGWRSGLFRGAKKGGAMVNEMKRRGMRLPPSFVPAFRSEMQKRIFAEGGRSARRYGLAGLGIGAGIGGIRYYRNTRKRPEQKKLETSKGRL